MQLREHSVAVELGELDEDVDELSIDEVLPISSLDPKLL